MAFVYDFLDIPLGFDAVSGSLLHVDADWLTSVVVEGMRAGGELRLRLTSPGSAIPLPTKRGRVDLERPYRRGDAWVLPFHWRPTGPAALFPQLEAELEVAPLGEDEVRLSFSGHFRPPLGGIGQLADTVLLHRVVERSVRVFLATLADRVRAACTAPVTGVSTG